VPGLTAYSPALKTPRAHGRTPRFDERGYDADGYDKDGFHYNGFNADGLNRGGQSISDFPPKFIETIRIFYERAVAAKKPWNAYPTYDMGRVRQMYPAWYSERELAFPPADQVSFPCCCPTGNNMFMRLGIGVCDPTGTPLESARPPSS
jgi:hypothetical protein